MFGVDLICSDEACASVTETVVASLDELDLLACDGCGCTLQSLAIWEVVELRPAPARGDYLPLAA